MVYGDLFTKSNVVTEKVAEPEKKGPPATDAQALLVSLLSVYEPARRIALLQEGIQYWPGNEALLLIDKFFSIRYKKMDSKIMFADLFLGFMIEVLMISTSSSAARAEKELTHFFEKSPFVNWVKSTAAPELRRELFFGECMQMLGYYVDTCRSDRQYASGFLGLVKAKPEKIENKLSEDLTAIKETLERAEASAKFSTHWTTEMKIFRTALDLFITNM